MKTSEALKIVGGLSKPSKMPGWAYGIPAAECKTGKKLQEVPGSTCEGCYATKGCYVFPVVQAAQYRRLEAIKSPLWVGAMALLINSKKSKWFRWHDSGDIQDVDHFGEGRTCPAPDQSNECKDCRACWDPSVKNVAYGKH
jgi:hypothetical protein